MPSKTNFIQIFENNRSIVVPIIQRDYAQGRTDPHATKVRAKFLQALYQAVTESPITLDFIYGDINENNVVTLLDGQQRITTLFLLYWYAAKKSDVPSSRYAFLKRFGYETRYSSRQFCEKIIDYQPDFNSNNLLSTDIANQNWFPLGWKKDPTIRSMLVMLDSIDAKFRDVDDLWDKLDSDCISFYYLPIKDMGLTDELYIKMNSRGKPLSEFENFKAEFEGELEKTNRDKAHDIASKIDGKWTDLLWTYKDDNNTIDETFLRLFRLVCQIICYKDGNTLNGVTFDSFWLLDKYYSFRSEHVEQNIDYLIQFFDAWSSIAEQQPLEHFFAEYLAFESAENKIRLSSRAYNNNLDLLSEAATNDKYTLPKLALFYAFTVYVEHRSNVLESDFRRRIRIVNNLIQNSTDEISDNEKRVGGNRMPAILRQIDNIILEGKINQEESISFNTYQLEEEVSKLWLTTAHPELSSALFKLEDHELLYGQIGIVGVDNAELFPRFTSLFQCSIDKVNCALMATGDYSQKERRYSFQYQLGSNSDMSSWRTLFHHGSNEDYDATKAVLTELLAAHQSFTDEVLDDTIKSFLSEREKNEQYDWRYYYVKYPAFRPDEYYGKYYALRDYNSLIITTKSRCSENAYSPYLRAVEALVEQHLHLDYYSARLNILTDRTKYYNFSKDCINIFEKDSTVEDDYYGFKSYRLQTEIPISQNIDSIDTEDRIKKLADLITSPQPE